MAAIDVLTILATWLLGGFAGLSAAGAGALIVGVTASFALGIGLMVAVFHSSRSGLDESRPSGCGEQDRRRPLTQKRPGKRSPGQIQGENALRDGLTSAP